MNKKVIYTCIIGDYDTLKEPLIKTEGWDYICFTNQNFTSDTWKIIKVGRNDVKEQRKKKIYNEYILDDYDLSIWIDGSMYINIDLDVFVKTYAPNINNDYFALMDHPSRYCTYQEAHACIALNKDSPEIIMEQIEQYKSEKLPSGSGMVATGVMIRKHCKEVKEFCKKWYKEVEKHSKRDQLSFNYVAWKTGFNYVTFPFEILRKEIVITNHK